MARTIQTAEDKKKQQQQQTKGPAKKAAGAKAKVAEGSVKKPHRWRPGTKATMDIRRQQKLGDGNNAIPRIAVERIVREVLADVGNGRIDRITHSAISALQQVVETEGIQLMLETRIAAEPMPTVMPRHLKKVLRLREIHRSGADPVALARARATRIAGDGYRERLFARRAAEAAAAPQQATAAASNVSV